MNSLSPSSTTSVCSDSRELSELSIHRVRHTASLFNMNCWLAVDTFRFAMKRCIDFVGASVGLLSLSPVMLVIILLIRLDSPGPILFRQLRRGYRGRTFWVLKFRTMVVDAEKKMHELESKNESRGGVLFKMKDDPRITPLGRFLRRSSLDELPQLINVLRGEMSLVGPRPLQLRDSNRLEALHPEGYKHRLRVMPGLTGPWQIGGRSEVDSHRMVEMDIEYVENWSLIRDFRIILKTFFVVLLRQGAY